MPWQAVDTVDLRREFVQFATQGRRQVSALCRRYGISRKTGNKWLKRYAQGGAEALHDRSRRPQRQPRHSSAETEGLVLSYRRRFPEWGGRKLARVMRDDGLSGIPSPSTITEILRRHGELHPPGEPAPSNYKRFEHPHPNDLWQMDFKGAFALERGRCHALTILDDHSRFSICLAACCDQRHDTVKAQLVQSFEHYGLPQRMTMDNGAPWGSSEQSRFTRLTVWLIENGVTVGHSRPYHPQTQGKDERFHRTLEAELLGRRRFADHDHCQSAFDPWRHRYNTQRPHEALELDTPIQHYRPSSRMYQHQLPPYEYAPGDQVRKVGRNLTCAFKNRHVFVGQPFQGKYVAFRPTTMDGVYSLHFCHQPIGNIDLAQLTRRPSSRQRRVD